MEYNPGQLKKELRVQGLQQRNTLSGSEVEEKSRRIFSRLVELDQFNSSRVIMAYIDFRNEVATRDFIHQCLKQGKRVTLPRVIPKSEGKKGLWACEISDLAHDLEVGTFGVMEPKKEGLRRVDEMELDLIIVPGVVFGENKFRIGYGAGYYDGFLRNCSRKCLKVGVAFEQQMVEEVPFEEHDIPLDIIITERRII